MPKKRFTDGQIAFALRQADGGALVGEICRELGVSQQGRPGRLTAGKAERNRVYRSLQQPLRQQCLNASWFPSMGDARTRIQAWRID